MRLENRLVCLKCEDHAGFEEIQGGGVRCRCGHVGLPSQRAFLVGEDGKDVARSPGRCEDFPLAKDPTFIDHLATKLQAINLLSLGPKDAVIVRFPHGGDRAAHGSYARLADAISGILNCNCITVPEGVGIEVIRKRLDEVQVEDRRNPPHPDSLVLGSLDDPG